MIQVFPEEIQVHESLPYDIVSVEGTLLLAKGLVVSDPEQANNLRIHGWIPYLQPMLPIAVKLVSRGRPPLANTEVLIADDMPLIRQLLTRMLRDHGIKTVTGVENGRLAITYFFQNRPHIVFLDINMPTLDGLSALKQIKCWMPDSFVCMVSANSTLINAKQARADGVDAFLVKPISPLNVKRVLARYQSAPFANSPSSHQ
ncbi:MAG: response regulator [Pseudomonadota bacterium]